MRARNEGALPSLRECADTTRAKLKTNSSKSYNNYNTFIEEAASVRTGKTLVSIAAFYKAVHGPPKLPLRM